MEKSRDTKKGLVTPPNEVAADLPMIQLAKKSAKKARSSETQIKKEVQSIVYQRIKEASNNKSDADVNEKPKDELLEQMKMSVNKALLPGDNHSNGDDFSKPQSVSCFKRRYINSIHSDETSPKKVRSNEELSRGLEPTSSLPCKQTDIDKRWTKAKTGTDKARVIGICNDVCRYIKNKYHKNILHVRPSYDSANKDQVQFVVTTEEDYHNSQFDVQYSTIVRRVNKYSKEANVVMKSKEKRNHMLSFEDSKKIKKVINSRAGELLEKHRYLSAITGSGIRSRGFSRGNHELIQEVCILLYVQTKGTIPLDETEFPKFLDGIPVDVIEGEFQTCALAGQYQENLCIGCQIQSKNKTGTLGGFVEHPKYGLSAITCAHVVLDDDDEEIHDIQKDGKQFWNSTNKPIYQPDNTHSNLNYFGHVREARFNSGGTKKPGVDLAVVQIERRPPISGNCPDTNGIKRENVKFETGQACVSLNENENFVVKFGCTTEETSGYVQFSNAIVRRIENQHRYQHTHGEYTYRLYNQFEIRSQSGRFADQGDSGSLVFKRDVSGEYVCIGMVVGCILPIGNGVVTPISAILYELKKNGFKDFRLNKLSAIENRLSHIERTLDTIANRRP